MAVVREREGVDTERKWAQIGLKKFCRDHGKYDMETGIVNVKVTPQDRAGFERLVDTIVAKPIRL